MLQQCLIRRKKLVALEFRLVIVIEKLFSLAYFLTHFCMANLQYKINLSQIPNQPRELIVLTMPGKALRLCAVGLH